MPVLSTTATSRRGYLSQDELEQYANITITDSTEADDQISQAEEMIDAYIGPQDKFFPYSLDGKASAGSTTSLTLQSDQANVFENDYFAGMEVEIMGSGERRSITGSTKAGVLTVGAFTSAITSSSRYRISQLGKFPRQQDVMYDGTNSPYQYFKSIPDKIKRAVAAQVEFMIRMGEAYFQTDKGTMESETIGDYSYSRGAGGSGGSLASLIAPKAKTLLRGIVNRRGSMII